MLPDVLGYKLEKGKQKLLDCGYKNINIRLTHSPKKEVFFDTHHVLRIVRVEKVNDSTVDLLVCEV